MAIDTGRADWSGTAWHQKDMPAIWAAVADHTPDAYSAHLAGWRRTSELLSQHVARMLAYRDNLATAWNPARSPAAAIYLARFDADIDNAQRTLDASVANYAAYAAAMNVVSQAQAALKPIQAEYAANAAAVEAHRQVVGGVGYRGGAALAVGRPDVAARQVELTGLARSVMYRASQELIEATAALQVPPAYRIAGANDEGSSNTTTSPPAIEPVAPPGSWATVGDPVTNSRPFPNSRSDLALPIESGPSLTEFTASPDRDHGASRYTNPPSGMKTANFSPSIIGQIPQNAQSATTSPPGNSQPQGGVIGRPPQAGGVGNSNNENRTFQKQNTASTPMPMLHGGNGGNAISSQRENRKDLEPDSPWTTAQGISPVIQPDMRAANLDPGPAIGLA